MLQYTIPENFCASTRHRSTVCVCFLYIDVESVRSAEFNKLSGLLPVISTPSLCEHAPHCEIWLAILLFSYNIHVWNIKSVMGLASLVLHAHSMVCSIFCSY